MSTLPKRDESVRIPPAVRAAAARANALVEGNAQPQEQPVDEAANDTAQDGQPPLTATPAQPAPQEAPQPASEAPQEPVRPQRTPEEWEHAFNSVNERYRAQVRANNDLQRQLRELTQKVTELEARGTPELQASRLITPEEENEWGKELLGVVGKKAKEEVLPEIAELRRELDSIKGKVDTTVQTATMTAREQMFAQLDAQLPQWRTLNTDARFIAWLDLPDGLSDAIRQELLNEAVARNDAGKVLRIFRGFLAEEAATAPRPQPAPARKQEDPLAKLAAPGRARTAAANTAPAEKPIFTAQEISEFYVQVRQGKYRGREAEKERIERDIFDAQRDGRVVP